MSTPDTETDMRMQYDAVRALLPAEAPLAVLHIGAEHTALATGSGADVAAVLVLDLGADRTARAQFKHAPPTPLEMENAIAVVEDEVTRARSAVAHRPALYTRDASIGQIALLAGVREGPRMVLTLEAMEQMFDRLAAVTLGRPMASDALPATGEFAATLLILREFMHHLQFPSITVCR